MSEKPPTPAGENLPHTEPDTGRSLDEVAEANLVPATEPAPQDQIETVTERLNWHEVPHTDNPTDEEPLSARAAGASHTTPPPPGGGHGGAAGAGAHAGHGGAPIGGKMGKMFGGVFALFGWFFVHVVWQGLKSAPGMWTGGGGHSKPKASSGGHH